MWSTVELVVSYMLVIQFQILHYYQYCSFINKVDQLVQEKDVGTLDEMSSLEVSWFSSQYVIYDIRGLFLFLNFGCF
jgi:hypothetical protein